MTEPFWKTKAMKDMSKDEWESLCDGCGKCCCLRMEDEDTGAIYVTDIRCKLLDTCTARCSDYENRFGPVPDCVQLTPRKVKKLKWIPMTCAYRLVAEGKDLFDWHHLVSGSRETIHDAGMSVRGATKCETSVEEDDYPQHIVLWPGEPDVTPKG